MCDKTHLFPLGTSSSSTTHVTPLFLLPHLEVYSFPLKSQPTHKSERGEKREGF